MPIYEFRCNGCGQRASLFFRNFSTPVEPVCPSCKSMDLQRLMSRVAVLKSTDQQLAKLDEYQRHLAEVDNPQDAAEVERWARRVGAEVDSDLGSSFREMASQFTGEARPYDMYDPVGTLGMALEKRRAELMGLEPVPDPWDEYFPAESSQREEPSFVKEAREKGSLLDGGAFNG